MVGTSLGKCEWVWKEDTIKVTESKMTVSEFNMAEFKLAAIIKLI